MSPSVASFLPLLLGLVLAPLLSGGIQRAKAFFAGRTGQPLLQPYRDIARLLRKGAVMSATTTWVFRLGPAVALAATTAALALVPLGDSPAALVFAGDLVLFAALMALARFALVLAALDTGSSFEGMGASRELAFSALTEPALYLALGTVAVVTRSASLTTMLASLSLEPGLAAGPALVLVAAALLVVCLAENARIPVDDPSTHLELTMIHEVMVLDHSGPDLAFIHYGAALKLWTLAALLAGVALPVRTGNPGLDLTAGLAGIVAVGLAIGVIESSMARLRLGRVPQLLVGAAALSGLALLIVLKPWSP